MIAKDISFGTQVVQLQFDGNRYIRLNTSRNVVQRDEGTTVFANVETGKIKIVSKDAVVSMHSQTASLATA